MTANIFNIWRLIMLSVLLCTAVPAHAELVVIANAGSRIEHLSREEVVNIFMGRYRKLPDGSPAQPLDIKGDAPERRDFYKKLLDKSLAEISAYWARLIFSGRTSPPVALNTEREVMEWVAHDLTAIGYVEKRGLNDQVKAVYSLPE